MVRWTENLWFYPRFSRKDGRRTHSLPTADGCERRFAAMPGTCRIRSHNPACPAPLSTRQRSRSAIGSQPDAVETRIPVRGGRIRDRDETASARHFVLEHGPVCGGQIVADLNRVG